jgi:signal transduction histidine kinase
VELAGIIEAKARGVTFVSENGVAGVTVNADRQLLGSALGNLLQNAFKYTRPSGRVWLRTRADRAQVSIEIEDECGGLPPAMTAEIAGLFQQYSTDKSGLGLGLVISKRAVEAMDGELRARNQAGTGCVFSVILPRVATSAN